ncbi:MAG: hypothetical protein ACI9Y7_000371 [Dokdonia sp.]|jgi:uncharacterized protein YoxC
MSNNLQDSIIKVTEIAHLNKVDSTIVANHNELKNLINEPSGFDWQNFLVSIFIALALGGLFFFLGKILNTKISKQVDENKSAIDEMKNLSSQIKEQVTTVNKSTENLNNEITSLKEIEEALKLNVESVSNKLNKLTDITRNATTSLPKIMPLLKEFCENAINKKAEKFYVMNMTSVFGKVHSYNKRFINQYREKDGIDEVKAIQQFNRDIKYLKKNIAKCAETIEDFKMITLDSNSDSFDLQFLQPYFNAETENEDVGFVLYNIDENTESVRYIEENESDIITKITEEVIKTHKDFIDKGLENYKKNRAETSEDEKGKTVKKFLCDYKLTTFIPIQTYLSKNSSEVNQWNTIIVFAQDEPTLGDTEKYKRTLIAIESKEKSIFDAFNFVFQKNFKG